MALDVHGLRHGLRPMKEIGTGSFGSVYSALNLKDNTLVAVKSRQAYSRDEILNEVKMLKLVNHVNIANLVDVFDDGAGKFHMAIELCETDLYRKIESGTVNESYARRIIFQLLLAVRHLQKAGIAHRGKFRFSVRFSPFFCWLTFANLFSDSHRLKARKLLCSIKR